MLTTTPRKMKNILISTFLCCTIYSGFGQIGLSAKVISWKALDNLDSLRINLFVKDTLFYVAEFSVDEFRQKAGQFPRTLFKKNISKFSQKLKFEISYKYNSGKPNIRSRHLDYFSQPEIIEVPINTREEAVELEIHFQKYYNEQFNISSKEEISDLIVKKYYEVPDDLKLIRNWEPLVSTAPNYFIQNNSPYILHGTSADGNFEGILFELVADTLKQVYTGWYNMDREPCKQLYSNNYVQSFIRDHREVDNRFKINRSGRFIYKVDLSFYPYEYQDKFGITPSFSVNKNGSKRENKFKIYEYFELKDEVEIK